MVSWRLHTIVFLLLTPSFFQLKPSNQPTILSGWKAVWSPYHMVDENGAKRRLLKATIQFATPTTPGWSLAVSDPAGIILDSENIPSGTQSAWAHGFWLPFTMTGKRLTLSLKADDRVIEQRVVDIAEAENPTELPLRVDRLGRDLLHRLETRERSASLPHNRKDYLRQHDIVYRQPSPGWDEGLPLGNGDMGALVTGREGKEQNFHLDKTDIWLATAEGKPLGRSYAGVLNVRYNREERSGLFLQRLSLGRAEVSTQDGSFQSRARVHALRNRLEVEISAGEVEVSLERQPVPLWDNRASRLYGSWASLSSAQDLEQIRKTVQHAPHTKLEWGQESGQCWFTHTAPNLSYTLLVTVADAEIQWKRVDNGFRGRVRASGRKPIRLLATLATSREAPSPLTRARQLVAGDGPKSHDEWWQRFWTRSWIELPDRRFLYGLMVRFHMKQNGLRALLDTRQSSEISRASLVEAASAQTVAISETLVQSWDDNVRLFPCIDKQGRYRFGGLRAATDSFSRERPMRAACSGCR